MVQIPTRLARLPRDPRGYVIPANVYRDAEGVPHFTINDDRKRAAQLAHDLCPMCDQPLFRGRWFVGGPLSAFDANGAYVDLPAHHECAAYALQVCPYLALASYRKRIDARTLRDDQRDAMIFVDPTMMPDRPALFVCAMAVGQEVTPRGYVVPRRPFRRVEYWRCGEREALDAFHGCGVMPLP